MSLLIKSSQVLVTSRCSVRPVARPCLYAHLQCILAGVAAFSGGQGGNEGQLFAALLVNAVQLASNIICIIFVDKVS